MPLIEKLRIGLCVYSLLLFSFVVNFIQIVARPLDFIGARSLRLRITGFACSALANTFIFWFEYISGTRVIITGDELPPNERVFLISNHLNVEWMHLVCLAARYAPAGAFTGIFKASLKWLPIAWVGVLEDHILVTKGASKSKTTKTLEQIKRGARKLCDDEKPLWLFMFPEGTWLAPGWDHVKTKANAFAAKNGFPPLHNVLFPRSAGFLAVLDEARRSVETKYAGLDALYDCTVAYANPYHPVKIGTANPPSVLAFCAGAANAPREVHFHIKRYPLRPSLIEKESSSVPPTAGGEAERWLHTRFAVKKEGLLEHFEQHKCFPGVERTPPLAVKTMWAYQLFLLHSLVLLLWLMRRIVGSVGTAVFLIAAAGMAILPATGDKNKRKQKPLPKAKAT